MNKTDPTIDRVTTPYTLNQQLRLLMHDRDLEMDTIQVKGEMKSRRYLETMSDDALTRMIEETIRSVNHSMVTLIIDRVSGSGYRRVGIGDMAEQQSRLLQDARRYIELTGIGYEIAILRRIADDAMDILSQRREEVDNE